MNLAQVKAWQKTRTGRAAVRRANARLRQAIKGMEPHVTLFREGIRHSSGVWASPVVGYRHNGRWRHL